MWAVVCRAQDLIVDLLLLDLLAVRTQPHIINRLQIDTHGVDDLGVREFVRDEGREVQLDMYGWVDPFDHEEEER